jgi:lipopolysaccharide/colanic/teichoic acid biosynthesis glycosyltransferase
MEMNFVPLRASAGPEDRLRAVGRRCMDVLLAGSALVLFSPFMMVIALSILASSGWPILFSQLRLGFEGKPFVMYKFRKFRRDSQGGCAVTRKNDGRMTRIGRLMERTKFDELPQLWNILKGDMSIVGPRPESLEFADCFRGRYLAVLHHRPGIFGPNQVYFRNEGALYPEGSDPEQFYRKVLFPMKADIDLEYFTNRTAIGDIGWMVRGALAVVGFNRGKDGDAAEPPGHLPEVVRSDLL